MRMRNVFYRDCGFVMFLLDAISEQILEPCSSIGLVTALNFGSNVK